MRKPVQSRIPLLGRAVRGLAAAAAVAMLALPAQACSILPPPMPPMLAPMIGETESAFQERLTLHLDGFNALQRQKERAAQEDRQTSLWSGAVKVALVEIVSVDTDLEIPNSMMARGVRVRVKPVGWLKGREEVKGRAQRAEFDLAHVDATSCGPSPDWSVFSGKPGERFVVFMSADTPGQSAVTGVVAPADIVDRDLIVALAAQVRRG